MVVKRIRLSLLISSPYTRVYITNFLLIINKNTHSHGGGFHQMIKVKLFDQEHEKDLEVAMNRFLEKVEEQKLVDIKYNIAAMQEEDEEQIYCFSAMVIYRA